MSAPAAEDEGLAAVRTGLAWRRTGLAGAVVVLLAGRLALDRGPGPAGVAVAGVVLLAWGALAVAAHRRDRALTATGHTPVRRSVPLAALTVAGLAALGAVLVLAAG